MSIFRSDRVAIPYNVAVRLRDEGTLSWGLDHSVATKVAQKSQYVNNSTKAAFLFWNFVGLVVFGFSIYMSFTYAWWSFILGLIIFVIIARSNQRGDSENLIAQASNDPWLYEELSRAGAFVFKFDGEPDDLPIE